MSIDQVKELVEYMKSAGVDKFEVTGAGVKVEFGVGGGTTDVVSVTLTEEQREQELDRIKDRLKQVAQAADADLYYSAPGL